MNPSNANGDRDRVANGVDVHERESGRDVVLNVVRARESGSDVESNAVTAIEDEGKATETAV
jgi:hypothetical protein